MTEAVSVDHLDEFDQIIDVRSPSEFAEDHIPGAVNLPVLDDEERARIGTLYKQVSAFDAKKSGAALVARNIARHLDSHCADKPRNWRPLVYCWRGGNRSGSMAHVLSRVGWRAAVVDGGYRAYRRTVLAELETLPQKFHFIAVCGATGTGKSRFLAALKKSGAQVLDLEELARHRGSVLGSLPGEPQPGQKYFESLVWHALRHLDSSRPVHVEAESKKIGSVRVPDALLARMWQGECLLLDAHLEARIRLLKEEYRHFLGDPEAICEKLAFLAGIHGHEKVAAWQAEARAGKWDQLVGELLERHYDPAYRRATLKHYPNLPDARYVSPGDLSETGMIRAAMAYLDGA